MGYFIKKITPIFLAILVVSSVFMFVFLTIGKKSDKQSATLIDDSLPLGKYEDTLKITVGQMVSASGYINGETASSNVMYYICKEVMNIEFDSVFSANIGTAYDYQLNTYMLDGSVPDLFFSSQNQLSDLIEQGMVADLTEAYEKYASPALRLLLEYSYTGDISVWNDGNPVIPATPQLLQASTVDCKLYGIPFVADLFEGCPLVWIRADWYKKYLTYKGVSFTEETLNDLMPKNFGEYIEVIKYFSKNDPDGDGVDNTYGFSLGFESENLNGLANIYNAYPSYYVTDEQGKYVYGTAMDGMYDTINLLNNFYNEGYIEKNSAFDGQTLKKALAAGKIGSFLGQYWSIMSYGLGDAYLVNQNVDWIPWAIRDYDGNVIKPMVPYNISNNSFYCVGKDCANPEVIIILANHIVDRFFSDDGEFTKKVVETRSSEKYKNVASELEMYMPIRLDAPNKNIRYAYDLQKALRENDSSFLTLDESTYYDNIIAFLNDPKGSGKVYYPYYRIFCEGGAYEELTEYADYDYEKDKNNLVVNFKRPDFCGMNTEEMAKYNSIISDFENQELIFMYTSPISVTKSEWTTFVNKINAKGVSAVLEGLNK